MTPCLSFVALTAVTLAMARGNVTLAAAVAWYFFLTLCSSLLLVFRGIRAERQGGPAGGEHYRRQATKKLIGPTTHRSEVGNAR